MRHIPRRRFGQHFLHDPGVIARIVAAIAPQAGETIVEIGPGLGALTRPLLERLEHLEVIEIDRDLIARLAKDYPPERLTIHAQDVLKFDFNTIDGPLRIVGNLPYNISTPLLFHLMPFAARIVDGHFMLQREVVERMIAEPDTAEYGRLSVMLQVRFEITKLFNVSAGAFSPPPKVESAIARMIPRRDHTVDDALFGQLGMIVTQAFSQRRKTLRNALGGLFDTRALESLGIDPGLRAEVLSVTQYVALARARAALV